MSPCGAYESFLFLTPSRGRVFETGQHELKMDPRRGRLMSSKGIRRLQARMSLQSLQPFEAPESELVKAIVCGERATLRSTTTQRLMCIRFYTDNCSI